MSLTQEIRRMWESSEGRGILGQKVTRAAAALPGAAARFDIFTVTIGDVLITVLYGVCTVDETGGAITARFDTNPTAGTGPSYMSSAAAITACNAGDIIAARGDPALPLTPAGGDTGSAVAMVPYLCKVGGIGVLLNAGTGNSSWRWEICYIPLTEGALVTAA